MCGISGFYSPQKRISDANLKAMTNCLTHRGPDASGFFMNKDHTCGLGHRRLSIIDLSQAANQPMFSRDGRYVIVFNGEIYNYREIARDLKVPLKTRSDTEVLIEAFAQWGERFIDRVNGMFAFTIYDSQENRLYAYRDRIGIKPLFYYARENEFYFASEIKSFRTLPQFDAGAISKNGLYGYLHLGYIPAPFTIHENIRKFPAGSYAVIDQVKTEIKPYWKLEDKIEQTVISDYTQAKNELTSLLESAVKYRMISDVPFGTFLSGGIDSSVITAFAQKNSSSPVNTFSIGFEEEKFNETAHARKVAEHLGTNHHEMICSYSNALDLFDEILEIYDEPYASSSVFPSLLLSKFARQHVTMVLAGDGGDENFLGYGAYNWGDRLHHPMVNYLRYPIAAVLRNLPFDKSKRVASIFEYPDESKWKSHVFSQDQYCFTGSEIAPLLTRDFRGRLEMEEGHPPLLRKLEMDEEQSLFDFKYYLPDDLLVKVDRASMHYALEVRVPMLDHRLVTFAQNLHHSLRKRGNTTKYLLKEILYEMVPRNYFDRSKWGFAMPIATWLKGEGKHLINDYLNEKNINSAGVFKYNQVRDLVSRFSRGEEYLFRRIWILIIFQKWFADYNR